MKKDYDLYKCYGLFKSMQEKVREIEMMLKILEKELEIDYDWSCNLDLHYNSEDITIEDVKELCDKYFKKGKENEC